MLHLWVYPNLSYVVMVVTKTYETLTLSTTIPLTQLNMQNHVCVYIICIISMNHGNCNGEISFTTVFYIIFNLHCQWFLCLILDFSLILFFDIFSCSQIKYFFIVFSCFQLTFYMYLKFQVEWLFCGQRLILFLWASNSLVVIILRLAHVFLQCIVMFSAHIFLSMYSEF